MATSALHIIRGRLGKCMAAAFGAMRREAERVVPVNLGFGVQYLAQWAGLGVGGTGDPFASAASASGRKAVRSRSI